MAVTPPAADPALVRQILAQLVVMRRRPKHDPRAMARGADGKPRVRWLGRWGDEVSP